MTSHQYVVESEFYLVVACSAVSVMLAYGGRKTSLMNMYE